MDKDDLVDSDDDRGDLDSSSKKPLKKKPKKEYGKTTWNCMGY